MGTGIYLDYAYEQAHRQGFKAGLLVSGVIALFGFVILVFTSVSVVKPVVELKSAAERIVEKRELMADFDPKKFGRDEVGALARLLQSS